MALFRFNRFPLLWTLILAVSAVVSLSSHAAAQLITGLTVNNSTGYNMPYVVHTNSFAPGAVMYLDRTYTLTTVPSIVNNQTWIETANADKAVLPGSSSFMQFTVTQSAKVYVAHDSHITTRPTWLTANFMDTGVEVTSQQTSLGHFELFVNSYPAGATVTLGSNIPTGGGTSNSMYTVIVVPTATDTTAPTAPSTLQATCNRAVVVGLNWNKSTDSVGVAGYRILRGGSVIATVSGTMPDSVLYYADTTVAASTAYSYQVKAFDAAGNTSTSSTLPVTTPAAGSAGDAPYCQSKKITAMSFNFAGFTEDTAAGADNPPNTDGADLWSNTWATDGNTYTFFGDGWGLCGQLDTGGNTNKTSFGIAKMTGPSDVGNGQCSSRFSNIYGGYNSSHPFSVTQLQGKASSIINIGSNFYAIGNTFTGNGMAQYAGSNHYEIEYSTGNAYSWQSNSANWQFCAGTSSGPTLGSFCPSRIVQYGQGVANPDGYVYMTGIANTADFWCDSGCPVFVPPAKTFMTRVPSGSILTQTAYQYYAGLDLNGAPIWTTDVNRMQPIFSNRNPNKTDSHSVVWVMATGLGQPVYDPTIGRYIAPSSSGPLGQTSFYDAPNPWGPWTVISYNNFNVGSLDANNKPTGGWGNFGAASNGLGLNGVPAWTSADGKSLYFSFSGTGNASSASSFTFLQGKNLDVFSYITATLTVAP